MIWEKKSRRVVYGSEGAVLANVNMAGDKHWMGFLSQRDYDLGNNLFTVKGLLQAKELMIKAFDQCLKLTPRVHDSGHGRLYVKDQNGKRLVIQDQGSNFPIPFQLFTHTTASLEPECPVNKPWILVQGINKKPFMTGLTGELQYVEK